MTTSQKPHNTLTTCRKFAHRFFAYFILIIVPTFIVTWFGCAHFLKPDPSLPSIAANYATAEFSACDRTWNGLGVCAIERGKPISDINLRVQGYYKGQIHITSTICNYDEGMRYIENANIWYPLQGIADQSCVVSILVSPEFPDEEKGTLITHSLKGHLLLKVIDKGERWAGYVAKVGPSGNRLISVPVSTDSGDADVTVIGCGAKYKGLVPYKNGLIQLTLDMFLNRKLERENCFFQGIAIENTVPTYFTWLVSGYTEGYAPLAVPKVSYNSNKIIFEGDNSVSTVSLDNMYYLDNRAGFTWDAKFPHTARMFTVRGRNIIGTWSVDKREWTWME